MTILKTQLNPRSADFQANADAMRTVVADLHEKVDKIALGGPEAARQKHLARGKLPVPDDVQEAIRTLIRWSGDDPSREGLLDTPKRVARAWKEYCLGYGEDPASHLARQFEEVLVSVLHVAS